MFLFYIYTLLGFTNLYNITYSKKKVNSNINIIDYNFNILYYINSFIIFLLLLFNPLYYFINNINNINIGFIIYKFNYIIQFIILYIKFNKIIEYKFFENYIFYSICLFSQIFILFLSSFSIYINYIYINNNIFFKLLLIISDFYGIFIYFNSILFFILIFIKLLQTIYNLNNSIKNSIEINKKKGLIQICYKIINLKYIVSNYISNFNYIFNFFTIINLFSLSFIYQNYNNLTFYFYIIFYHLLSFFIIIEFISISIILYISKLRSDILNHIYSPIFVNNFIIKYDINTFNDCFNFQLDTTNININNTSLFNILEENSTSVDWIILNITLNSKWVDFNLCGMKIQSINSITKILLFVSLIYKLLI